MIQKYERRFWRGALTMFEMSLLGAGVVGVRGSIIFYKGRAGARRQGHMGPLCALTGSNAPQFP